MAAFREFPALNEAKMPAFPAHIPFVQAKWFTEVGNPPRRPQVIVIHSMEAPEKGQTAENVAAYFARGCDGRKASAHYCIDADSIVQCVQCKDVAYGAPNANRSGIHLEHAGYSNQTKAQWTDTYGRAMLDLSAQLCAKVLMPKFGIHAVRLTARDLRAIAAGASQATGFCTHADVTAAFKTPGGHDDPGPGFPFDEYLAIVKGYLS